MFSVSIIDNSRSIIDNSRSIIINDDSILMLQIVALLTEDYRGIIYNSNMFTVQATENFMPKNHAESFRLNLMMKN
jgi:hypothetical protein